MSARPQRKRHTEGPIAALLGSRSPGRGGPVLVSASLSESPRLEGIAGEHVADAEFARTLRERGDAVEVAVVAGLDAKLLGVLRDRMPPLLVLAGPVAAPHFVELQELAERQRSLLLGPEAVVCVGPAQSEDGRPTPVICAGHLDELQRLLAALGPARLALAPTPGWLPRWLLRPDFLAHDLVGHVPAGSLDLAWIDWSESLGPRELHQLLVPLGVPRVVLEPFVPGLELATVAHRLERCTGSLYPGPQVLALLRDAARVELGGGDPDPAPASASASNPVPGSDEAAALELWDQARRALPRIGGLLGMQRPDPAVSLRIPSAAFLAQRGLLRLRTSAALLERELEAPELPDPELLDRADAVLEGAGETLSDHESKVVLRGHGIEVTRQAFATSASGAASFADKIGYPVALKALSPELRRKRELGALALDVPNAAAVKRAYADIVANTEERAPLVALDGVVVAEMIEPGLDLRCGGLRMASGGVCMFAQPMLEAGVEPVFAPSPLTEVDALLLAEAALTHVPLPARRRASDPDTAVLATLMLRIDGLFRHTGERLLCVDLSPVRLVDSERRYVTLDARIVQRPHIEGM